MILFKWFNQFSDALESVSEFTVNPITPVHLNRLIWMNLQSTMSLLFVAWIGMTFLWMRDTTAQNSVDRKERLLLQLSRIVIPSVEFDDVDFIDAVAFTSQISRIYDKNPDPNLRGISTKVIHPPEKERPMGTRFGSFPSPPQLDGPRFRGVKVNLQAKQILLFDLFAEIARQGKHDAYVTADCVLFVPEGTSLGPDGHLVLEASEIWKTLRKTEQKGKTSMGAGRSQTHP